MKKGEKMGQARRQGQGSENIDGKGILPGTKKIMTDLSLKHDTVISFTRETNSRYNEYLDVLPFYQNIYNEGIEIYGNKIGVRNKCALTNDSNVYQKIKLLNID